MSNSHRTTTEPSLTDCFLQAVQTPRGRAITYAVTTLAVLGTAACLFNGVALGAVVLGAVATPFAMASAYLSDHKTGFANFIRDPYARKLIGITSACLMLSVGTMGSVMHNLKSETARVAALPEVAAGQTAPVTLGHSTVDVPLRDIFCKDGEKAVKEVNLPKYGVQGQKITCN